MYPEEGRSAIAAAARAVADLRLGRLDDETTANVGTIEGGTGRNVIPEHCRLQVEARSHEERKAADVVEEMLETFTFAAGLEGCEVEVQLEASARGYSFRRDDLPVRLAATALERTGREPSFVLSGGGADANVFNDRGLQCVNLANAMTDIHTPDERIAVSDLEAMVDVTLALVDAAREEAGAA
jgi:tripeptide aminopeptidase